MFNKVYSFEIFDETFAYLRTPLKSFEPSKLSIVIQNQEFFEIKLSYSYDKQNYSEFVSKDRFDLIAFDSQLDIYICIWFQKIIENHENSNEIPQSIYDIAPDEDKYFGNSAVLRNVNDTLHKVVVEHIMYDSKPIELSNLEFTEHFKLINEYPRWNFYDKQQISVLRWLMQCNAIAEMYGHSVIYFKTEPTENIDKDLRTGIHGTHYTLSNNVVRHVISAKKIHVSVPNNDLPQDRMVYTDWDMPLQDDFVIHIVRQKFIQAFGQDTIPNEKDYIYFPLLNKLFRVSTMQPKNGFMGVAGWYECYLTKFEDDEYVSINKELSDLVNIDEEITGLFVDGTIDYNHDTIEERKNATFSLSNRLEDTTFNVSLKETETLREFYDKRLDIVSINPEDSLFPITMYDCKPIETDKIALQYATNEYVKVNKFSKIPNNRVLVTLDYVLQSRFNGIIFKTDPFDFVISIENRKLIINNQQIDFKLKQMELYQICIEIDVELQKISVKLFTTNGPNESKKLQFQNIYNNEIDELKPIEYLKLFGGCQLIGNILLKIDGNRIIEDKCLPLLTVKK